MTRRRKHALAPVLAIYAGYAAVLVFFLMPVLWVLSLSFRPLSELFQSTPSLWPQHPTLDSYRTVLTNSPLLLYIWNSVKFALATVVGAMLIAVPSAYALSRLKFRRAATRKAIMLGVLAVQLISPLVTVLPLYRYFSALGLINSQIAVGLVYIAVQSPFATWMLKGFFDTIPHALDDAARVDGCSRLQLLVLVLLPVMLPGLSATAILLTISTWGQFLIPYILLDQNALQPVGVGILEFQSTTDAVSTNLLAAAAVLSAVPAIAIFIVLQRFIIAALTSGAVKG
jgi:multiple sugar transport system permease protein